MISVIKTSIPKQRKIKLVAQIIMLVFIAPSVSGQIAMEEWVIDKSDAKYPTDGIESVEIQNHYGNIRTRASKEYGVELHTVIQHHQKDLALPIVTQRIEQGKLLLEVVYPAEGKETRNLPTVAIEKRRIDIALFVPENLSLKLETRSGYAESKGHKGQLSVATESGNIKIVTKGNVDAHSGTGAINASHKNRSWTGISSYRTKSGDIRVALMEYPNVVANIETDGAITTDYSLNIRGFSGSARKIAKAVIGSSGETLAIKSEVGKVRLARIFDMIQVGSTSKNKWLD